MAVRPPAIHVRVRLFAMQRELAGTREVGLDLPAGATVEDAWRALVERLPVLAPGRPAVRFARNREYVDASTTLADGDELACIPPVSGGAAEGAGAAGEGVPGERTGSADRGGPIVGVQAEPFAPDVAVRLAARLVTPADGAVVTFLGVTRETPGRPAPGEEAASAQHAGEPVEALTYEAHEDMAAAVLATIAAEVEARFGVTRLALLHRTGLVPLGEPSVVVVAAAPHRDVAFAAARYAIDEAKARAPIWKAERYATGHVWTGEPARTAARDESEPPEATPDLEADR
ncbi:MAG TPA: molybdenum cofactor biosynthesis protein MoaE [Candidatus Limnocylindrales bacterium]